MIQNLVAEINHKKLKNQGQTTHKEKLTFFKTQKNEREGKRGKKCCMEVKI